MNVVVSFLLGFPRVLALAFVFMKYWNWFAVPFWAAKEIGMRPAIGAAMIWELVLFAALLISAETHRAIHDDKTENDYALGRMGVQVLTIFVLYPLCLLEGWVWHLML